MTPQSHEPDPLRPMLATVEVELEHRLAEACSHAVTDESTAELMRLEETLSEAARAAKQAVSLRRRLRSESVTESTSADEAVADDLPGLSMAPADAGVRELRDSRGTEWRIWAVTAEQMHASRSGGEHLGDYKDGWLTFEAVAGDERRRLPHYPSDWNEITDQMLERLLDRAERVRKVKRNPLSKGDESRT
jgi:hypothetical protein